MGGVCYWTFSHAHSHLVAVSREPVFTTLLYVAHGVSGHSRGSEIRGEGSHPMAERMAPAVGEVHATGSPHPFVLNAISTITVHGISHTERDFMMHCTRAELLFML
ncbi:hypothetical protein A0H81_14205 [Grifola frondosa]|uniref:Uncharacterized protein n=1 Tax=Grifola frondosa TaxID=5627 RepID=A0A1C7LPP0_GRIFR|nr:hypothetical protein A0H81_14205 [Grifola frondosa]